MMYNFKKKKLVWNYKRVKYFSIVINIIIINEFAMYNTAVHAAL